MCDNSTMADDREWGEVAGRMASSRKGLGISQDDLAAVVGLDRTAVTKIETGRRHINTLELVRLAEVLHRPLDWFVSSPPASIISRRAAVEGGRGDQNSDYAIEDVARDLAVLVDVQVLAANSAKGSLRALHTAQPGWAPTEPTPRPRTLMCP